MRIFFRRIHLYLGLAVGLVIIIVCFTGASLAFEKELQTTIYPERYYVAERGSRVSIERLIQNFKEQVKGAKVNAVRVFDDPSRSVIISYSIKDKNEREAQMDGKRAKQQPAEKKGEKKSKEKGPSPQAFMNPYTGELISLYEHRNSFFHTMLMLHRFLLMGETGKLIQGSCVLIFLFILITGIILWWPKTIRTLKQQLKFNFKSSLKKVSYDLHLTLGSYTAIILFVLAFTGLAWSFEWFNNAIYAVTASENKRPEPPPSVFVVGMNAISVDQVVEEIKRATPVAEYYSINYPKDSVGSFSVSVLPKNTVRENATDQYYFDQYTGAAIGKLLFEERNLGQRVRATFYSIHVGSIGGKAGKFIVFFSALAGVTFPITGVVMWINRTKKKKKAKLHTVLSEAVAA